MTAKRIVFSSDQLPVGLGEAQRRALWHDLFVATIVEADIAFIPDRPMSVHFEFAQTGSVGVGAYKGTMSSISRTSTSNELSLFHLTFNCGGSPMSYDIAKRAAAFDNETLLLFDPTIPSAMRAASESAWRGIQIAKQPLLERVPNAEDLVCRELADTPASRMFRRYVEMLSSDDSFADDLVLSDHVETTLLDLAVLALGGSRDHAALASMRGLRAARARQVVSEIRVGFADPALSPAALGRKLSLSPRYINELLQETGASFAERVLELRLTKACAMLASARHDRLRISEIAFACGFNDVSYFNRCFRRRFGASPTQYRGGDT